MARSSHQWKRWGHDKTWEKSELQGNFKRNHALIISKPNKAGLSRDPHWLWIWTVKWIQVLHPREPWNPCDMLCPEKLSLKLYTWVPNQSYFWAPVPFMPYTQMEWFSDSNNDGWLCEANNKVSSSPWQWRTKWILKTTPSSLALQHSSVKEGWMVRLESGQRPKFEELWTLAEICAQFENNGGRIEELWVGVFVCVCVQRYVYTGNGLVQSKDTLHQWAQ